MKARPLVFVFILAFAAPASATTWTITSPQKHQTYAYGDDEHRNWYAANGYLALHFKTSNVPYADGTTLPQVDDFTFTFPDVRLSADGKTFYYTPQGHAPLPVARRRSGIFGIKTVELLPNAALQVNKYHGLLTMNLYVTDGRADTGNDNYYDQ